MSTVENETYFGRTTEEPVSLVVERANDTKPLEIATQQLRIAIAHYNSCCENHHSLSEAYSKEFPSSRELDDEAEVARKESMEGWRYEAEQDERIATDQLCDVLERVWNDAIDLGVAVVNLVGPGESSVLIDGFIYSASYHSPHTPETVLAVIPVERLLVLGQDQALGLGPNVGELQLQQLRGVAPGSNSGE